MAKNIACTFTLSKISEIKGVTLKYYKSEIKRILRILLSLDEIKSSIIFKKYIFERDISKIRFDVSFCDDETIRDINRDYRQKDCPTDVITFSLFCDDENSLVYRKTADLGQIIVSIETADRQKKETLQKEVLTLVLHGILHLIGFDHLEKRDYDFVVGIQNKVIGKLWECYEQVSIKKFSKKHDVCAERVKTGF